MTVEIRITADTAEQARAELIDLVYGSARPAGQGLGTCNVNVGVLDVVAELNATDTAIREPTTAPEPASAEPAPVSEEPKRRGRKPKAEAAPEPAQISTGEERIGPEDDAATAAQDAADEAAEVEEHRDPEKPLTHDDLRAVAGQYQNLYGMAALQSDLPTILDQCLGPVPAGTKNAKGIEVTRWAVSAVPGDQATLQKVVAAVQTAVSGNPFKRAAA